MSDSLVLLFEDFQGRKLKNRKNRAIEDELPATVYPFGTAVSVLYYCDKRDPGDPEGEGAQGYWKFFIHEHDPGVVLYCRSDGEDAWGKPMHPKYPKSVAWLGELKEITYIDGNGKKRNEKFRGYNLWVWSDEKTMFALPKSGDVDDVIIWSGGKLKVTKYGIEH